MADVLDWLKSITGGDSSSSATDEFELEDITRGFTGTANTGTSYQPNFGTTTYADDNYSNEGRHYKTPESTRDSPVNITTDIGLGTREQVPVGDVQVSGDILSLLKGLPKGVTDFAKENPEFWKLLLGGIGAYLGATQDVPEATGGGYAKRYVGPEQQLRRSIDKGPYGPIARHKPLMPIAGYSQDPLTATSGQNTIFTPEILDKLSGFTRDKERSEQRQAGTVTPEQETQWFNEDRIVPGGGETHWSQVGKVAVPKRPDSEEGYANGGKVKPFPMQDGGFVMTKRAVDGAGGPQGLRSLIPEASMIRGPGHGTSDSIPAYIQGPRGRTPAKVSNGEAYIPPGNDTRQLYALMRALERKA